MHFKGIGIKIIAAFLAVSLVLSLASCGTVLYPERRGQTTGKIDPGVAILNGVGLIVFLVPGLVAFAIDFTTGAIYLPQGKRASLENRDLKVVRFQPEETESEELEKIIEKQTGTPFTFSRKDLEAYVIEPAQDEKAQVSKLSALCMGGQQNSTSQKNLAVVGFPSGR